MTRPIPKDILETYLKEEFSSQCCFCHGKRPQLHHNLIFGGRQVNEPWAFLPLCKSCHDSVNGKEVRALADWAMLNRATDDDLTRYSKVIDYKSKRAWLNKQYGEFSPRKLYEHARNFDNN